MAGTITSIVFFLTCVVVSIATDTHITTVSGRKVLTSDLTVRLRTTSLAEAKKRLYEISNYKLRGHDVKLDLNSETSLSTKLTPDEGHTVIVDGKDVTNNLEPGYIRHGKDFTVVHMGDGSIVSVSGSGLFLTPLDDRKHPGLFINTGRLGTEDLQKPKHVVNGNPFELMAQTTGENTSDTGDSIPSIESREIHVEGKPSINHRMSYRTIGGPNSCRLGKLTRQVEIAGATDSFLCKALNGNTAKVRALVHGSVFVASQPYLLQTCVTLNLTRLEIHCNAPTDPYRILGTSRNYTKALANYGAYWNIYRKHVSRDIVFFFPGWTDKTKVAGVALLGRACVKSLAYGLAEGLEPIVISHEIGHLLGIPHVPDGGIMGAKLTKDTGFFFSPLALKSLFRFLERFPRSRCITKVGVPSGTCGSGFTGTAAFTCEVFRSRPIRSAAFRADAVNVELRQEYRQLSISFRPVVGVKIFKIALRVSFIPEYSSTLVAKKLPRPMTLALYVVRLGTLKKPYSSKTCCGGILYITVALRFCRGNRCAQGRAFFRYRIQCGSCADKSLRLIPSSQTQKCPACRK